jgi:hypothetical protein
LLGAINEFPTIVEPHTVHGRLTDFEANFVYKMCETVVCSNAITRSGGWVEFRRSEDG